jgi:nitroimidazol reductase NimA-like FMN-containing flavoprotein (pyridoxamine 5'-phosphate oxidase superfamily)
MADLSHDAGPGAAPPLSATGRTRHRRLREQGRTAREDLFAVLAAGLVAHLGVIVAGVPMVVPTSYGFDQQHLYLHGSVASQSLADRDAVACVTVTLIYGVPRIVTDPGEKLAGLRLLSEHMAPGQWDYARQPNRKELAATRLLVLRLDEASVKIRTGPPDDGDSPDAKLGLWAGELPLTSAWGDPVPDPALPPGIGVPGHVSGRAGTTAFPAGPAS